MSGGIQRFPSGFRRRLALAFVAVAGVAAGSLAVGASLAVTSYRHHSFRERARSDALADIRLLEGESRADALVAGLEPSEQPGGPGVLVIEGDSVAGSVETLGIGDIPGGLRSEVARHPDELVSGTTSIRGDSILVLGTNLPDGGEAYFFFSQEDLLRGLTELSITLLIGWVIVLGAAAVVGTLVARRTLRPVRAAAEAARSVTEGLLETRLSVDGDDEFGQWAESFNEMVGALEDKIQALERARDREQRFNADVAHELRTPLGALVTAATLLGDNADELPPDLQRPAAIVVAGARRLHRLVDELLELHRLEAGQEVVDSDRLDMVPALHAALVAHGWDRAVEVVADSDVPPLQTDRRRVDRVIANLIGNALDHGGGDVTVTVTSDHLGVGVAVSDRGPGIEADDLRHLFDRYFKVSRSRTTATGASTGGSGLGLAIAAEQARLLGGRLDVESTPGAGATFTLWLPFGLDERADGDELLCE